MPEKKIVVKLKYGASASQHRGSTSLEPQREYDWNYRRIAFALVFGLAAFGLLGYRLLIGSPAPEIADGTAEIDVLSESVVLEKRPPVVGSPETSRESSPMQPEGKLLPEKAQILTGLEPDVADTAAFQEIAKVGVPATANSQNVVRARFAWGIKDKEPTREINSPAILQPGDSVVLYFFSELKDMNGQTLTHEWSHNGSVVVNKDFHINGDRWRVFSSKQLNSDLLGQWKVAIRDSNGENLGEFALVVLEPQNRKQ